MEKNKDNGEVPGQSGVRENTGWKTKGEYDRVSCAA